MLTYINAFHSKKHISFAFREISDREEVHLIRDALLDALETCVSYNEAKEAVSPYTLYLLTRMIDELNFDLEDETRKDIRELCYENADDRIIEIDGRRYKLTEIDDNDNTDKR